ncbi:MAG TPA: DUF1501 domain-containing protein, partial [Planctomycetaceae bacterium]|nr:DUF1501 domain-containing protein [Planctomycetaceae bacterium]
MRRSIITSEQPIDRREMLVNSGAGFAAIAMAGLLDGELHAEGTHHLRLAQHAPKAKSAIFLFMEGGPSQMDLFDPKPKLREMAGQQL